MTAASSGNITGMKLTPKQVTVLGALIDMASEKPTARALADRMETPRYRTAKYTYDEVYAHLRALDAKGAVNRYKGLAVHWEPTDAGKAAHQEATA